MAKQDGSDHARGGPRPPRRLAREEQTVAAMIAMYCRDHHGEARPAAVAPGEDGLCADCAVLLAYARLRLEKCRYGAGKPTCAKCPTHCYKPEMRERVREVMRYSGPRMVKTHPVLAVAHLVDGRRVPPGGSDGG
jgi:hypothetical protein